MVTVGGNAVSCIYMPTKGLHRLLGFSENTDIFRNFDVYGLRRPEIIRCDNAAWVGPPAVSLPLPSCTGLRRGLLA